MNLKLIYGFLFFALICKPSYGQIELRKNGALPYDSLSNYLIEITADRYDVSNSLNRSFIQKIDFGGHINNDLKQSVADRFEGNNYYRRSMNPSLSLTVLPDSGKFGYTFSYRFTNYIDLSFADDLFNLIFYGNTEMDGRRVVLSKSDLNYQSYHSLSFGLIHKQSGSFLSFGLYDGFDYRRYKLGSTAFVTEYADYGGDKIAETIQLSTRDSEFLESSQSYKPFGNGVGIGLSGAYVFEGGGHTIQVSAHDVGMMYWRNLSRRDTTGYFEFNGFDFTPGNEGGLNNTVESLIDSIMPASTNTDEWVMLPGFVRIEYYAPAKKRFFGSGKALHYYGRDSYTEFAIDLNMKYGENNFLWITGGIGGYSSYIFGLGTEISVFKGGVLKLGTRQVLGILDARMPASHAYIQYTHRL